MILFVAFLHFFPQYTIRTRWDGILLHVKVMDTLNTIDRLGKTYDFATDSDQFEEFMNSAFYPEKTGGIVVWWKAVDGLDVTNEPIPYFTRGYKESMVDVELIPYELSVDANTVALWHFNENSGTTANDESPNNNDGTLINMEDEGWVKSILANGLHLDGDGEYVEVADDSSLNIQEFTIEAWIKPLKSTNEYYGPTLLMRENTTGANPLLMRVGINSTGHGIFSCEWDPYPNYWRVNYPFEEGNWYFVVCTKNSTTRRIYVNAELIGENGWVNDIDYTNVNRLFIGQDQDGGNPSDYFNGTIDEIRILNRALSEEEIKDDFGRYGVYGFTLGLGYPF